MLKSQPVRRQTVGRTPKLAHRLTHSSIHSLLHFLPPIPAISLSHLARHMKNVALGCHCDASKQREKLKVCNSNKLVVKEGEREKNWTVGGPVANYCSADSLFRNLISPFVRPLKKKTCSSRDARAPQLFCTATMSTMLLCQRGQYLCGRNEERLGTEATG